MTLPLPHKSTSFHFAFALVAVLLYYAPGLWQSPFGYSPFAAGPSASAAMYEQSVYTAAEARRLQTKGALFGETDNYELRHAIHGGPVLAAFLVGSVSALTRNFDVTWVSIQALFAGLLWLSLFKALGRFTRHRSFRVFAAWAVAMIFTGNFPWDLLSAKGTISPLELSRLEQPVLALFLVLVALSTAGSSEKRSHARWSGIFAGLVFYASPYSWLAITLGYLILAAAIRNRRPLVSFAFSIVVAAPYLSMLANAKEALYPTIIARIGDFSRGTSLLGVGLMGVAPLLMWVTLRHRHLDRLPRNAQRRFRFTLVGLATLTGAGLALNLQSVTGFSVDPNRYLWADLAQPLAALLAIGTAAHFLQTYFKRPLFKRALLTATVLMLSLGSVRQLRAGYVAAVDHGGENSARQNLLAWVRGNVSHQAVVGTSDPELLLLIPGITGNWNFVPAGLRSITPDEEILKRYRLLSYLEGKSATQMNARLGKASSGERMGLRPAYALFGQAFIGKLEREVTSDFNPLTALHEFRSRRLDYLIVPQNTQLALTMKIFQQVSLVYQNHDWMMVRLDGVKVANP